jgi:hypothetical protein
MEKRETPHGTGIYVGLQQKDEGADILVVKDMRQLDAFISKSAMPAFKKKEW